MPAGTIVLISIVIVDILLTVHVDAIPDREHDEPTKFIADGKLTIINEVLIN
jgi:hypothetical protein